MEPGHQFDRPQERSPVSLEQIYFEQVSEPGEEGTPPAVPALTSSPYVASPGHPRGAPLRAPAPQEGPEENEEASPYPVAVKQVRTAVRPPESIDPPAVYALYRGVNGSINGQAHRVWVEFTAIELCWARHDAPARPCNRLSLLRLFCCQLVEENPESDESRLDVYSLSKSGGLEGDDERKPMLQVSAPTRAIQEFGEALARLVKGRDEEGKTILEFISRRLFQYLWVRQGCLRSEEEIYEAQAVLAFNLEPKEGVSYLRGKLGKSSDAEVGEWLAHMSFNKGGIDPTLLGNYFSRLDTIEVTRTFISRLCFDGLDLVDALRRLFDTFKPGGESQVIGRILEFFAETYLSQWQRRRQEVLPLVHYSNSDSVLQVAYSLIMLNTGLHVLPKKNKKQQGRLCRRCCFNNNTTKPKKGAPVMTVSEYIRSARGCVGPEEVPEEALRRWYEVVRDTEISVEPLPRVPFSTLPVQPDIEGWLIAVLGPRARRRLWAVLALQRLYLFSDRGEEIEPSETVDLKDYVVCSIARDTPARERLRKDQGGGCLACLAAVPEDLPEMVLRSFELSRQQRASARLVGANAKTNGAAKNGAIGALGAGQLQQGNRQDTLVLVAETPDLMERWVNLISAGAFT